MPLHSVDIPNPPGYSREAPGRAHSSFIEVCIEGPGCVLNNDFDRRGQEPVNQTPPPAPAATPVQRGVHIDVQRVIGELEGPSVASMGSRHAMITSSAPSKGGIDRSRQEEGLRGVAEQTARELRGFLETAVREVADALRNERAIAEDFLEAVTKCSTVNDYRIVLKRFTRSATVDQAFEEAERMDRALAEIAALSPKLAGFVEQRARPIAAVQDKIFDPLRERVVLLKEREELEVALKSEVLDYTSKRLARLRLLEVEAALFPEIQETGPSAPERLSRYEREKRKLAITRAIRAVRRNLKERDIGPSIDDDMVDAVAKTDGEEELRLVEFQPQYHLATHLGSPETGLSPTSPTAAVWRTLVSVPMPLSQVLMIRGSDTDTERVAAQALVQPPQAVAAVQAVDEAEVQTLPVISRLRRGGGVRRRFTLAERNLSDELGTLIAEDHEDPWKAEYGARRHQRRRVREDKTIFGKVTAHDQDVASMEEDLVEEQVIFEGGMDDATMSAIYEMDDAATDAMYEMDYEYEALRAFAEEGKGGGNGDLRVTKDVDADDATVEDGENGVAGARMGFADTVRARILDLVERK